MGLLLLGGGYGALTNFNCWGGEVPSVPVCLAIKNPLVADGGDVSVPNEAR